MKAAGWLKRARFQDVQVKSEESSCWYARQEHIETTIFAVVNNAPSRLGLKGLFLLQVCNTVVYRLVKSRCFLNYSKTVHEYRYRGQENNVYRDFEECGKPLRTERRLHEYH